MTAPSGRDTTFCLGASKTGGYLRGLCPLRCSSRMGCQLAGGAPARRPSFPGMDLGKADRLLEAQRPPFDVCVTSVIKPREYYWKHASLASDTVS